MSPKFSMGHLVKMIDLDPGKNDNFQIKGVEGWISLFLVIGGEVTVTEWHPAFRQPRQFVINQQAAYCTRHNMRRKVEVGEHAVGYLLQIEESLLCWRGLGRGADDKYRAAFYRLIEHADVLPITSREMARIDWICKMFSDELITDSRVGTQIITCIIDLLLMLLIRHAETVDTFDRPVNLLLHKFNRLLEEQYKTEKKVSGYARKLSVTAGYLNSIVKRDTGHSVGYHIRKRIATEALRQARHMDTSVKEVANMLGFADSAHFSKFFKKVTGVNFSSFRHR